jgi:hypothetical protein
MQKFCATTKWHYRGRPNANEAKIKDKNFDLIKFYYFDTFIEF